MHNNLKAVAVAATLVGVWGSAQADATFSIANEKDLTYATGFFQYNPSGDPRNEAKRVVSPVRVAGLGGQVAGTDWDMPHTYRVDGSRYGNPLNTNRPYTFMGAYDLEKGYVSVLLNANVAQKAIAQGLGWDEVFLPTNTGYMSENEAFELLESIHNPETFYPYAGSGFLRGYESLFPKWNEPGVFVNFSVATFGGTGVAEAPQSVPEPSSILALSLGAVGFWHRRKKA